MPSLFGYSIRYATIARCPNYSAVINQLAKSKVITDIVGEKNALMNELTQPESSGPIAVSIDHHLPARDRLSAIISV